MTSLLKKDTEESLIKQIKKIFKDLEEIFKQALINKSYAAALKAKELQLKDIFFQSNKAGLLAAKKMQSIQDIEDYFSDYDECELMNLNAQLTDSDSVKI